MHDDGAISSETSSRPESAPHSERVRIDPVEYYVIDVNLPVDRYHVGELSLWRKLGNPWEIYSGLTFEAWQNIVKKEHALAREQRVKDKIAEWKKKREADEKARAEEAEKKRKEEARNTKGKKPSSDRKPPSKEELAEAKKKRDAERAAAEKSVRDNIESTDGREIGQRAFAAALQKVARDPGHRPVRAPILRGIAPPSKEPGLTHLLGPRLCRALSTDEGGKSYDFARQSDKGSDGKAEKPSDRTTTTTPNTQVYDYKIPTWPTPGSQSIYNEVTSGTPTPNAYGGVGAPVILMVWANDEKSQEETYEFTRPRIRIHAGRGVGEPAPISWTTNLGDTYHVIQEDGALNTLAHTYGCVRISRKTANSLAEKLAPLKERLKKGLRDFVGFVIVREDLEACAASAYCGHKAVEKTKDDPGSGPNFQPDKRTKGKDAATGEQ